MSSNQRSTRPLVTICGLGPGGQNRLTAETEELLAGDHRVLFRTGRHPGVSRFDGRPGGVVSFDHVYQSADSFEEVYRTITDAVTEAAMADGQVVYAVPGSPLVLERSVRYLRASPLVDVELLPAVSFLDEVWASLAIDPIEESVRLIDGLSFGTEAAGERGPLLVAHTHSNWVLSDIKLALDAGPEQPVVVLQALGTDRERIVEVGWPELDQVVDADHLTTLYIPEMAEPVGRELLAGVEMMHRLRQSCPWDREQTHQSLRKYLIEEAYEVIDAIDALGDAPAPETAADNGPVAVDVDRYVDLEEELGDLWFQVLFHAELAAESGYFTMTDVARGLREKMVRRHPHVYGAAEPEPDPGDLVQSWEQLKRQEKDRGSVLDGVPTSLPALALAEKVLKKAAAAGSPAELGSSDQPIDALLGPTPDAETVGHALLAIVAVARNHGINSEQSLRSVTRAAADRFRAAEGQGRSDPHWARG